MTAMDDIKALAITFEVHAKLQDGTSVSMPAEMLSDFDFVREQGKDPYKIVPIEMRYMGEAIMRALKEHDEKAPAPEDETHE